MEDTDMTKNKYMTPAMEMLQAEVEQMVAESAPIVKTNGLDEDLKIDENTLERNPWEFAW